MYFLGLVLGLASLLLFLALATYHATDPSLNTSTDPGHAAWRLATGLGRIRRLAGDLILQSLGLTGIPAARCGWAGGAGVDALALGGSALVARDWERCWRWLFLPALLGLLPWHWEWMHAIPVEGVMGRLMAGLLVAWLNRQGAWLVAAVLAAAGMYFALAISFRAVLDGLEDRWANSSAWHDRWRNWREERAELQAERELIEDEQRNPGPAQRIFSGAMEPAEAEAGERQPSRLAALFGRRAKPAERDPLDEIPGVSAGRGAA